MIDANAHVAAFLARLNAETPAELDVHDGEVPNLEATPYLVVYPDPGVASWLTLKGESSHLDITFMVHAVGASRWQAGWAADRGRDAVLDVVLTVEGRVCRPIRQEMAQPAREDAKYPSLWLAVATYRLETD